MSIFSTGDDGNNDSSPENKVIELETEIVKDISNLQQHIEEALKAEISLIEGLENGVPENVIEERISNIEIYLQEDISPEEASIESHIQKLEDLDSEVNEQQNLSSNHRKLLELIEDSISKTREEKERLGEVVREAEKVVSGEGFSHDKLYKKLETEVDEEEREARILEEEISEAEKLEEKIQSERGGR